MSQKSNPLLQVSPYAADGGELIGRDPGTVTAEEWRASDAAGLVGLKAIRAKCLDCVVTANEIRKCVQTDCPLWPLRMGAVPKGFREALRNASEREEVASGGEDSREREFEENGAHGAVSGGRSANAGVAQ